MTFTLDFNVFAGMSMGMGLLVLGYLVGYGHCWFRMTGRRGGAAHG